MCESCAVTRAYVVYTLRVGAIESAVKKKRDIANEVLEYFYREMGETLLPTPPPPSARGATSKKKKKKKKNE